MTETANETHCKIIPVLRHGGGGLSTEWAVFPCAFPWGEDAQVESWDGFESMEAAIAWATANGYAPDLRAAERGRLDHMLGALNDASPLTPDDLAEVITNALDIAKLARFSVRFRQLFEKRVMSVDPITGLQEGPSPF